MSFDGNLLHKLTIELQDKLTTGRINKIYQLSQYDLLLVINSNRVKHKLLISASPNYARIHLTDFDHERPDTPPTFCMFLRKHIDGGILKNIYQKNNDRVIVFELDTRNELGDKLQKNLIIEVTGRHANIIVTDNEFKILEAMKHIMPFENAERTIYPSALYRFPDSNKIDPFIIEDRNNALDALEDITERSLLNTFMGFSPLITKEIMYRYRNGDNLKSIIDEILSESNPTIIDSDKEYFYYTDITSKEGPRKHYNTVNELLDRHYLERDSIDNIRQRSKDILKFVKNQIDKQNHKIEKLSKELRATEKRDKFKIKGELIQAHLYEITKGDTLLKCINYYDNSEIEIVLDPKKDAIENMEKYFKKYKKLRVSIPHIDKQLKASMKERKYFEELRAQIEFASLKDIEEIKDELEINKYLKKKVTKKKIKKKKKPNFETFVDADGVEILVGKNNIQNEFITHKFAKHNEVWFHVKEAPGSHVVARSPLPLSETTIRTASQLAAYFSKLRKSSSVPVDYVEIRYLKKVPGRIGSFVTYKNNKTIFIDPEEDFVVNLRKK